jgi:hypothetical protein
LRQLSAFPTETCHFGIYAFQSVKSPFCVSMTGMPPSAALTLAGSAAPDRPDRGWLARLFQEFAKMTDAVAKNTASAACH